jgi:CheY-like chemotaxis protein
MISADDPPANPQAKILLVDDRQANRLALEAILAEWGQDLVQAASGEDALRQLLAHDFAVVLLDVQMQGLDGYETAQLIRGRDRSRHTPIIFLTAYRTNRLSIEQAYALGAVDYLIKPVVPVILRAKVAGFVELYHKTAQIRRQAEQLRALERQAFERQLTGQARQEAERFRLVTENVRDYAIFLLDPGGPTKLSACGRAGGILSDCSLLAWTGAGASPAGAPARGQGSGSHAGSWEGSSFDLRPGALADDRCQPHPVRH